VATVSTLRQEFRAPGLTTRSERLIYAVPGVGLGFMQSLIQFYLLKFSTDVLLLSAAWMGLLLGIGRIWDGLSDPLAGYWSDRTRSTLGRRRPWLLLATMPLAIAFAALWSAPRGLPSALLMAWIAGALWVFVGAQSAFQVPHLALAAELTVASPDRNRVFGLRLAFTLLGFLLAALALGSLERAQDIQATAANLGLAAALLTAALCATCAWYMREPRHAPPITQASAFRAFVAVLRNPQARRLLVVLFFEAAGFATMTTSMVYASEYLFMRQGASSLLLGSALIAALASVPLWLGLAHRFSRRRLWLASLAGRAAVFGAIFFLPPSTWLLIGTNLSIGALFGAGNIFGPAVQADMIDAEARRSGERKEGTFFATWSLVERSGQGVAIALSGLVLALSDFAPNVTQEPSGLLGLRVLFAGLPCGFYIVAALLLAGGPSTSQSDPHGVGSAGQIVDDHRDRSACAESGSAV
jgi:Na+/melibiose symporter-like transporter